MSIYVPTHNIFYHHIPRTGGTWVREVLFRAFGKNNCMTMASRAPRGVPKSHPLLSHIVYTKRFKPKEVFTFVRHPFAFYESVWLRLRMRRRRKTMLRKFTWHPLFPALDCWDDEFSRWVVAVCNNHPAWYARLLDMYVGPQGAEFCGFVGRTETLRDDLFGYLQGIDDTLDLPNLCGDLNRVNVSERKGVIEWPTYLKTAVYNSEHEVVGRFYG